MQNIAVVYATKKGQTRKIAEHLGEQIEKLGAHAKLIDASRRSGAALSPRTDGIIIGGPVYAQRYPRALKRWVRSHREQLHGRPTALFSVSLNAGDSRPTARKADDQLLQKLVDDTGFVPSFAASLVGAIKYREYSWPIRRIIKRISTEAGGPLDTSRDYELTQWEVVDRFATDFVTQAPDSAFAASRRLAAEQRLNALMPEFEHFWSKDMEVNAKPEQVYAAFQALDPRDMRLAALLAKLRTIGQKNEGAPAKETFTQAAERFGNVTLVENPPREFAAGLIGQFWKRDFGVRRVDAAAFASFAEPGYAKVVTAFEVEPIPNTTRSRVHAEMRIHATSPDAARKFNTYWTLLNPGIKLYMRSMLSALRRQAAA